MIWNASSRISKASTVILNMMLLVTNLKTFCYVVVHREHKVHEAIRQDQPAAAQPCVIAKHIVASNLAQLHHTGGGEVAPLAALQPPEPPPLLVFGQHQDDVTCRQLQLVRPVRPVAVHHHHLLDTKAIAVIYSEMHSGVLQKFTLFVVLLVALIKVVVGELYFLTLKAEDYSSGLLNRLTVAQLNTKPKFGSALHHLLHLNMVHVYQRNEAQVDETD